MYKLFPDDTLSEISLGVYVLHVPRKEERWRTECSLRTVLSSIDITLH